MLGRKLLLGIWKGQWTILLYLDDKNFIFDFFRLFQITNLMHTFFIL